MGDRISEFILSLGGDDTDLRNVIGQFKSRLRSDVSELQTIADKLDLFGALSDNLPKVKAALDSARAQVKLFRDEIAAIRDAGAQPTKALVDDLAKAEAAARAAGSEFKKQTTTLEQTRVTLVAASVDVSNYGAAQTKMAAEVAAATEALALQNAKDLLGFKSLGDVQPRITELQNAFNTLKESGKLSATELATAQGLLSQKVAETRAEVTGLGAGFKAGFSTVKESIIGIYAPILATTAALAGVTAAISSAVTAAKDFANETAKIGTVTNLTKDQLFGLAEGARAVAKEFGLTGVEAQKALYDILRSNVAPAQALDVLRISAEAARASFSTLDEAVKASDVQLDVFGRSVGELRGGFDVLLASQHNNSVTLAEFGAEAGKAGNLARAAGVNFNEFVAILETLKGGGLSAADAFTAVSQAVQKFVDPNIRANMAALGLSTTNLATALQQMAARNLPIDAILQLENAGGRAAAAFATLSNQAGVLPLALDRAANAAGTTREAFEKLLDTPAARQKSFDAAWDSFKTNMGEVFGTNSIIGRGITATLDGFNSFSDATRVAAQSSDNFAVQVDIAGSKLFGLEPALKQSRDALEQFKLAITSEDTAKAIAKIDASIRSLSSTASGFLTDLEASTKSLQAAVSGDISQLNARADLEIAALDRSQAKIAQTAAATIAIETKTANDRFVLIQNGELKITDAVDKANAARIKLAQGNAAAETKAVTDSINARVAALRDLLVQWTDHYTKLHAIEVEHERNAESLDNERLSFNRGIEAKLFELRVNGLSPFDQYVAKVNEAERLAGLAREAGAAGDLKRAKEFADAALQVAGSIQKANSTSGVEIISQGQAQQKQIDIIKGVRDDYNKALDVSAARERDAGAAMKDAADDALEHVKALRKEYDALQKAAEDGVTLKVQFDEVSLASTRSQLDELTKARTVLINTEFAPGGNTGGATGSFARGGYVDRAPSYPQLFHAGGMAGGWKVPGTGSGDTVPAVLQSGSFVLRKAAASYFGDSTLSAVSRYAAGGPVGYASGGDVMELHALKVAAENMFATLRAGTQLLPRSEWGQNVGDYLGKVLDLIEQTDSLARAHALFDPIASTFDALLAGIDNAKRWHVPFVMGVSVAGSASGATAKPGSGNSGSGGTPLFSPGNPFGTWAGFAQGGPVHALLEPGEWVMNPAATARIGSDVLAAANALRLTPGVLSRFAGPLAPLPRFSNGGPVAGASIPSSGAAGNGGGLRDIHVHNYGEDLSNPAVVRRVLLPVIREIERRSN